MSRTPKHREALHHSEVEHISTSAASSQVPFELPRFIEQSICAWLSLPKRNLTPRASTRRRHNPVTQISLGRGHAQTETPALANNATSASLTCTACTSVVFECNNPHRSSSSTGRRPCLSKTPSIRLAARRREGQSIRDAQFDRSHSATLEAPPESNGAQSHRNRSSSPTDERNCVYPHQNVSTSGSINRFWREFAAISNPALAYPLAAHDAQPHIARGLNHHPRKQ